MVFDEIWSFVEYSLKTPIPSYFKYILKYCGYNNGISIATIQDNDITYFVTEVRNGNVSNYFREHNVLEGCLTRTEDFQFSRGHHKLLMYIVTFLKNYIAENGPDSFFINKSSDICRKRSLEMPGSTPQKRIKQQQKPVYFDENLENNETQKDLLSKAIMSIITCAPETYVKNFKLINGKIDDPNFVKLEINEKCLRKSVDISGQYVADIICPICSETLRILHSPKQLQNNKKWNITIFDDHLKIHENYFRSEFEENFENADVFETQEDTAAISGMLEKFVDSANRHYSRKKKGYRHDDIIKMFAAFLKMVAGLFAYEILHANFPLSLPSVSTVNRFIADKGPQIIEGEMRTKDLLQYLKSRKFPLTVSISEDATRITPRVCYDPSTNQLVGFTLPLDENGMPIKFSFLARNVGEIQKHFSNSSNFISSTVYVQMAQPIEPNSSPFTLMLFLTDNTFTAKNIFKRWNFQAKELKGKGIRIENISTDGDPRCVMVMKCMSRIGITDTSYFDCEWFSCGGYVETTFSQDMTHTITKSRNRILTFSRIFPIGNKIISSSHLLYLIDHVSKDEHSLVRSDIEPKDRQNFLSAEKMCSKKTIQCLIDYVPGSEGTVLYLKAMNTMLTAFLDINIKSMERVYLMWYSVFFFRAWRSWIVNSDKVRTAKDSKPKSYYNLKENFISSNCYTCIEINAHTLVKKLLSDNYGEREMIDFFFPNLFGSQPCEQTFRQLRSLTSTYLTNVNCNMLDGLHRFKKIELQNDIMNNANGEIKFPRFEKKATIPDREDFNNFERLSRAVVILEIEKARQAVICDLEKLEIDTSKLDFHCQIRPVYEKDFEDEKVDSDLDSECDYDDIDMRMQHIEEEPEEEIQEDLNTISGTY